MGVYAVDKSFNGRAGRIGDLKFGADAGEQLFDRQLGIEEIGDIARLRNLLEQAAADRGFARADLAGKQHEPAVAADAVEQMRKRLLVAFAHVQVARVGREREGRFAKAKVTTIHISGSW